MQVPWHARGWPRFQFARKLCRHWGSRLGPLASRRDKPSSSMPVVEELRAGWRPLIRFFLVYVQLTPRLFFHSVNITHCESDKLPHSIAVIISCSYFHLLRTQGMCCLFVSESNEWPGTINTTPQLLKLSVLFHWMFCCCCCSLTQETADDEKLTLHFSKIVQDMEEYLNPLLTQFDFSCLR